jgi:hypothetical protein
MTAEMPRQVAPAPGAAWVCFPWTHASNVVAALNAVQSTLTTQLEARPLMTATLTDWTGAYRDGFDVVLDRLTTTASDLVEAVALRAGAVVTAAEDANDDQFVANRHAVLASLSPFNEPVAGGPGGSR